LWNQANFHFQKFVWVFKPSIKIYKESSKRSSKKHFLWQFQTSSLKIVHNFWLEAWNLKQIFGNESWLDLITFEKNYSTMPKQGLKFYFNHNSYFWLNYERLSFYSSYLYIPYSSFWLLPTTLFVYRACLLISSNTNVSSIQSSIAKYIELLWIYYKIF